MTDRRNQAPRAAIAILCTFLLFVAFPPRAQATSAIGLSTGTFKFNTIHGKTLNGDLYVSNEGDTPVQVLVYSSDIVPNAKGVPQFVLPKRGTMPTSRSPASWATINAPDSTRIINNAPYLRLGVGERSHVFFTIDVPRDASAGDYSMAIFFEMFNVGGTKGNVSRIGGRLGCRVQVRVQGRIFDNVSVRPFTLGNVIFGSTLPYSFTIHNDGNIDHEFASTLQLLSTDEEMKQRAVIGKADYIYARGRKPFEGRLALGNVGLGKYIGELHVAYVREALGPGGELSGAKADIVKQRTFYVVPWSFLVPLVAVVLVLIALVGAVLARRSRRRAQQAPLMFPPGGGPARGPGPGPGGGAGWEPPGPMVPQPPQATAIFESDPVQAEAMQAAVPTAGGWTEDGTDVMTDAASVPPPEEYAMRTQAAGEVDLTREEPEEETILAEEPPDAGDGGSDEPLWKKQWGRVSYYGPGRGPDSDRDQG